MIKRLVGTIGIGVLLAGCGPVVPPPETVTVAPPAASTLTLPLSARVLVFAGQSDLDRRFQVKLTRSQTEDDPAVRDGLALARAAETILSKAFARVAVNDPALRPHLVVRSQGKGSWARTDNRLRVGCALDVFTADGFPLGTFAGRYEAETGRYAQELTSAYVQCLRQPVAEILASPVLARLAAAGFRDPPAVAVDRWMQSQGPMPTLPRDPAAETASER